MCAAGLYECVELLLKLGWARLPVEGRAGIPLGKELTSSWMQKHKDIFTGGMEKQYSCAAYLKNETKPKLCALWHREAAGGC